MIDTKDATLKMPDIFINWNFQEYESYEEYC